MKEVEKFYKTEHYINLEKNSKQASSIEEVFTNIRNNNMWGSSESYSGPASELLNTQKTLDGIKNVIHQYDITSMLDIPCGDANWIHYIFPELKMYIGADIVEQNVLDNNEKFNYLEHVSFKKMDICETELPTLDLIFVRDLLMHLSNSDTQLAIENIYKSGAKYLLVSQDTNISENIDTFTGGYRPINLEIPPFNLPKPIHQFEEKAMFAEDYGRCMSLFQL